MAFDANDLSPHEHFVVERTRAGEVADFTPMAGPGGAKPAVRAGFIRKLMLGLDESWAVRTPGVRIKGARIEGALDLTDCSGAGGAGLPALALVECEIPEVVDVSHARLARLSLRGSRLTRLIAVDSTFDGEVNLSHVAPMDADGHESLTLTMNGARIGGDFAANGAKLARAVESTERALSMENARVGGSVMLNESFEALGCVWLVGASIGASLECGGSKFLNRSPDAKGYALVAANAEIAGDVLLRGGFAAEGEVRFEGAHIRGDVDLEDGVLRNEAGDALTFRDADIAGSISCHGDGGGCKILGAVTLQGAKIGRNLDLSGVEISHRIGADKYGCAIDGASIGVGGALLLRGASIKGEVFLADARIGGYLAFGGGRFINGGGWAIRAPNARVGGNLTIKIDDNGYAPHGQKTVIEGGAKFDRAQIAGSVSWLNLELRGAGPDGEKGPRLSFAGARVDGALEARGLVMQQDAHIVLASARCATLDDDLKSGWGATGAALDLEGFDYQHLKNAGEKWSDRLAWLKRSRHEGLRYSPQPFIRMAEVYARAGRRNDARRILLAQQDLRALHGGPLTVLFGLTAGYGLAPMRIVAALVLFIALGIAGTLAMDARGALVRPNGTACNGAVEPALYAIDVALPVIDLRQETKCGPGRTARADLPAGVEVPNSDWRLFEGAALWKWAQALYAILGAILSALAVITFSGVMKPKDD